MSITELVNIYQEALTPIYGVDSLRLYWCNECFFFDKARNLLVSSDTAGEIVYEEGIDITTLPHMIIELVKHLKDAVFVSKEEQILGETPWGYDEIKNYEIKAKCLEDTLAADYVIGNICIKYC